MGMLGKPVQVTLISLAIAFVFGCGPAAAQTLIDMSVLEAAAERGEVSALVTLAGMYERGENVERDFSRSNAQYCKAAARGDVDAMYIDQLAGLRAMAWRSTCWART